MLGCRRFCSMFPVWRVRMLVFVIEFLFPFDFSFLQIGENKCFCSWVMDSWVKRTTRDGGRGDALGFGGELGGCGEAGSVAYLR